MYTGGHFGRRVQIIQQFSPLGRGGLAADLGTFPVEADGDGLQGVPLRFDVEEVHDYGLDDQPKDVTEVPFPLDVGQGHRVDVIREEGPGGDTQQHDGEVARAQIERTDLDHVADQQARPGKVVEQVEDKNEGDDRPARRGRPRGLGLLAGHGPPGHGEAHAERGGQEQGAAAEPVDREGHARRDGHVEDGDAPVDDELRVRVRDADLVQDQEYVVADDARARRLREYPGGDDDEESVSVAPGGPHLRDAVAGKLLFQLHGLEDFLVLALDELLARGGAVEALEDLLRRLVPPLDDVVPGTLGHQPNQEQLDDRREGLQDAGGLPRPVALHLQRAVRRPTGDDGPEVPQRVVDGRQPGPVLRVRELGDEHGRTALRVDYAEADDEPGRDEHADVDRHGLQDDPEKDQ